MHSTVGPDAATLADVVPLKHATVALPHSGGEGLPLVGYLVLAAPGTDPAELLRTVRERLGPVAPDATPAVTPPDAGPEATPAVPRSAPDPDGSAVTPSPRAPAPEPSSAPADRPAGLRVDTVARTVTVDDRPLALTYLEYELLTLLVTHPHRVYSRDQLVTTVWGYGPVGDRRTVDVHVARVRRKLGAPYRDRIVTVHRVGYKYVADAGR